MKKFKMFIDTTNAAFEDEGPVSELTRILRTMADQLESHAIHHMGLKNGDEGPIMDVNGNTIGAWEVR